MSNFRSSQTLAMFLFATWAPFALAEEDPRGIIKQTEIKQQSSITAGTDVAKQATMQIGKDIVTQSAITNPRTPGGPHYILRDKVTGGQRAVVVKNGTKVMGLAPFGEQDKVLIILGEGHMVLNQVELSNGDHVICTQGLRPTDPHGELELTAPITGVVKKGEIRPVR